MTLCHEESEGSSDEEDTRDMEGKMHTAAGMEVIFLITFHSCSSQHGAVQLHVKSSLAFHFQIDRASAGNVKRSNEEIAADPEKENEFGYTMSE